jgi:hypothetical protein
MLFIRVMKNSKINTKIWVFFLLFCFMFISFGCGTKVPVIKFKVKSNLSVNDGQPVYLLIRTINGPEFVTDDYQAIADLFNASPFNNTVISSEFIIPGDTKKFVVTKPDDKNLGIYCMFTKPDGQWKILIQKPLEKKYVIVLENNELKIK